MRIHKKLAITLLGIAVFMAGFLTLTPRANALTADEWRGASFRFVDRSTIQATTVGQTVVERDPADNTPITRIVGQKTVTFIDANPFDDKRNYKGNDPCTSEIDLPDSFRLTQIGRYPSTAPSSALKLEAEGLCGERVNTSAIITNAALGVRTYFNWLDAGSIQLVGGSKIFLKDSSGIFIERGVRECADRVYVDGNKGLYFELDAKQGYDRKKFPRVNSLPTCKVFGVNGVVWAGDNEGREEADEDDLIRLAGFAGNIGNTEDAELPAGSVAQGIDEEQDDTSACVAGSNTGWEWGLCPAITAISKGVDALEGIFISQLRFNTADFFNEDLRQVWSAVKNIVSALLVIILLIMVISQAFGGGPFEAYTVRKMLPRLVIAVVAMQLSWEAVVWLVTIANHAGDGIKQIMFAPFGGGGNMDLPSLLNHLHWSSALLTQATFLGLIILAFKIGTVLIFPILLLVFIAFVAIFVALSTVLVRNIFIILAAVFAPLAILLWIMPGQWSQNYWKKFTDNFARLLLLYPIMVAFIAAGRIFAYVVGDANGIPGAIDLLAVFVGFFAPLIMLPATFKWGGSLLSSTYTAIAQNKALLKGKEVGMRELGEYGQRRRNFWASEYSPKDSGMNKFLNSLRSGRVLPTRRARDAMIARGDEYKSKEAELVKAAKERARQKEASRTGNVMAGKQMDLDTITEASSRAADAALEGDLYAQKLAERDAKEAMRDLVATGSTLELNNYKIRDVDGKEKFVWQTKMWGDLLNASPDLYREVKGLAPDWVPHRTPVGLPTYRGEYTAEDEARQRTAMAERGMSEVEINDAIASNRATAEFRRTAGGEAEYVDDIQWASSLQTTVEELDAQSLARMHPTYFERIGDKARKGQQLLSDSEADHRGGRIDETTYRNRQRIAQTLLKPAQEFGTLIQRLARDAPGRQTLAVVMGGADTMEHLDAALQYSGTTGAMPDRPKGQGSMEAIYREGETQETLARAKLEGELHIDRGEG